VVYELNDLILTAVVVAAIAAALLLVVGIYRHCRRDRKD